MLADVWTSLTVKSKIETRHRRCSMDEQCDYFEADWKPKSWQRRHRFIFVRQLSRMQNKLPVQRDLFAPYEYELDFKVILTNESLTAEKVTAFHNGRGSLENIFFLS